MKKQYNCGTCEKGGGGMMNEQLNGQISIDEICRSPADLRKMLQELNNLRDEYAKDKDIWTLFKIQFLKLDIRAKYRIQL